MAIAETSITVQHDPKQLIVDASRTDFEPPPLIKSTGGTQDLARLRTDIIAYPKQTALFIWQLLICFVMLTTIGAGRFSFLET